MGSFSDGFLLRHPLTHQLAMTLRAIGEHRGREVLYRAQSPQVLEALKKVAIIESTESSNRIEGVVASKARLIALVEERTEPRDRSEQEIAGYRFVLDLIHVSGAHIPFSTGSVLQLHRDLYRYLPGEGGAWKRGNNEITEVDPAGHRRVRFKTVAAHLTASAMDELHGRFGAAWKAEEVDRLLLIPAYVLDFLCIHPFTDGNGRMARLLTLLLLYQAGYEVGRYISLEQCIEESRAGYYDSLSASSQGWHDGHHSLAPWWGYFLGVLLAAYGKFEARVGDVKRTRGAKSEQVAAAIERLPSRFRFADLERNCPGVSHATVRVVLNRLKKARKIRPVGHGTGAVWEKC